MRPEDVGRLRFVEIPEHRWAHCHFPRAGSWSARTLAADLRGGEYRQPNDQTAEQLEELRAAGWLTSWLVREPVGRFHSVYRHFARLEERFQRQGIVYAMSQPMRLAYDRGRLFESIDTFAERAFNDFPQDKHIAPQTGWGAERCEIIAPLECSDEVLLPIKIPRVNAAPLSGQPSRPVPVLVHAFYSDDTVYWERVCANFRPKDFQARASHLASQDRGIARV